MLRSLYLLLNKNGSRFLLMLLVLAIIGSIPIAEAKRICPKNRFLNGSKCVCEKDRTGANCEDFACGEHGISVGAQYDKTSLFFNKKCICDIGWGGELCDQSTIDRCGGRGENKESGCRCRENYVGPKCQFVKRCENGQLGDGVCSCFYGWRGDFCDTIICNHGGYPDRDAGGINCICPRTHRGRYCDFCADPNVNYPDCLSSDSPEVNYLLTRKTKYSFVLWTFVALAFFVCFIAIACMLRYRALRSASRNASIPRSAEKCNEENEKKELMMSDFKVAL